MSASFKVWHCHYSYHYRGGYTEYDCIVVAEIESKALGMALMANADTEPQNWTAKELPIDKEAVFDIASYCI